MSTIHVALMGNPNAGKTTIFNALTGMNQHVGNWPGKTVEKKEGRFSRSGSDFLLVDLPGTYSLSAYSPEEGIARDYLLYERPDVVVIVLDAANLERNLYLATQALEMGVTAVVVLNMMDDVAAQKIVIDTEAISRRLGVPVIPTIARRMRGLDALTEAIVAVSGGSL